MKTKKVSDILSRLVDVTMITTTAINDFTVGSTIRSIYEAVSLEVEQFYALTGENITWGIQEGVLSAFDFTRKKARRAFGNITIKFNTTLTQPIVIPKGTTFESSLASYLGVATFQTEEAFSVPAGSTQAVIEVYCTASGTVGNFPKNTINRMMNSMSNIQSVTNTQDFLTGQEEESIDSLRNRFRSFVETRSRATSKALEYGARLVDDIVGVYVYEQTGLVTVYCHDNNGNLSDTLKNKVLASLETYRPVGVKLVVSPVELLTMPLTVNVYVQRAYMTEAMRSNIAKSVRNVINTKQTGDNFVIAEVTQAVMNLDDINIKNAVVVVPSNFKVQDSQVYVKPSQLLRSGTITVNFKDVNE